MSLNNEQFPPIFMDPKEFQEMKDRLFFLDCLEEFGVDNWEGYSEARRAWREEIDSRNE